jgi:hypothetical protein
MPASIGSRITYEDTPSGFEVVIRAQRQAWPLVLIPFWLILWTLGGMGAIFALPSGSGSPFLALWLVFWAVGWCFTALWWNWISFGRERVRIADRELQVSRELHRWRRFKTWPLDDIRDLRAAGYFPCLRT